MRVGVNLCWLVPGDVGGSEQAMTRSLHALGDRDDVEIVLFVLDHFTRVHPDLTARFETHTMPVSGPLSAPGRGRATRAATKPLRVAGETRWLPRAVRKAAVDVLHDAGGTAPGRIETPRVLGIHDIQPLDLPGNFHPAKVAWLRRAIPRSVDKAAVITVPSEFVRDSVVRRLGVDPASVHVVPWSAPAAESPDSGRVAALRDAHGLDGPVIAQAAITYPHKDHVTTVAAFARIAERHPAARLVLAGGIGPAEDRVLSAIDASGVADRIVRTGRLDDDDIAALIAVAQVVVVPSRYEGFGIPALEAMAAGTPVIVAAAGSLPEVVGEAGAAFPPGDDAQLAVELHHVLVDDQLRDRRIAAGTERAAEFSPARTADGFVAAYRAAAGGPAYRSGPTGR